MADVTTSAATRVPHQKIRTKKMSTRIDFTPMVDLGFLLITFFMLTTTLNKPTVMPVVMPERDLLPIEPTQETKESQVLTFLLGGDDKIYWYEGITNAQLDSCGYAASGLRRVLLDKKDRVKAQWGDEIKPHPTQLGHNRQVSRLTVIIKATDAARYANIVDVFDEMKICGIAYYLLLDVSPQEYAFIKNPATGLHFDVQEQMAAITTHRKR
jgi:biopolymer transport protein ExbD